MRVCRERERERERENHDHSVSFDQTQFLMVFLMSVLYYTCNTLEQ